MARQIGKRQLEMLLGLARYQSAMVVGNSMTERLEALGLVRHHGSIDKSFAALTPAGLREVANACEDGRIEWFTYPTPKAGS